MQAITEQARKIKLLIMDVDGVLTDGRIYYNAQGEESKSFYVQDGLGLKLLQSTGVRLAIISGRADRCGASCPGTGHRLLLRRHPQQARSPEPTAGTSRRQSGRMRLHRRRPHRPAGTAPRRPGRGRAGRPTLVRQHAHYVTGFPGGQGAVRELAELIMQAQGSFDAILARYMA
jgi:3-deoxy-D-manno-octulosonate 8-phosphate phosphatase (KDO 8-P phosphatase)